MKIKVRAFGDLMSFLGNESIVELEDDARLKHLISKLVEKTDSPRKSFLGRYDLSEPNLVILLNGRNIYALEKLETPLKDGDVVAIFPLSGGG